MTGDDPDFSDTARKYYGKQAVHELLLTVPTRRNGVLYWTDSTSSLDRGRHHRLLRDLMPDALPDSAGYLLVVLWHGPCLLRKSDFSPFLAKLLRPRTSCRPDYFE